MAPTLPTLSAGQLDGALRCPRRLASLLGKDRQRSVSSDARFRVGNAVSDAIITAHTILEDRRHPQPPGTTVDDLLVREPPKHLSVEEQYVYVQMIDQYAEVFADDEATLDPRSSTTQYRNSAAGQFVLSAKIDLLFRRSNGSLELRRVSAKRSATHVRGQSTPADAHVAAILVGRGSARAHNDTVLHVARLSALPTPTVDFSFVTLGDLQHLRTEILAAVLASQKDAEQTTEGWWCTSCPAAIGCPAIAQRGFEEVIQRMQTSPGSDSYSDATFGRM